MRLFTPAILRISANGISNLLDKSWMEGHFYFIAEEAAKSNKSVFHKTIRDGFLYYLGTEVYNEYLRPHNVIGYGAERSDELYLYLYSGLVELIDFLSYHELETKNLGIRLDRYIEELLEEYDRTGNTKIGTIEFNGNLKKAWMYLLEKNSYSLANLKHEYASRFAERVFHDREMCEYISRQLQFSRYGWGTYGTNHTDEKPAQWIKREKWPKWVERAIQVQRCLLMTTNPGDLVLDITCGSGTTANVAEQWGRRWITCDTSRVALTLAKPRLMTANFAYYKLAYPNEGISRGFEYKTVPHITLKSIANNEPPATKTLYDQPYIDNKKTRITGPFTVEAVPAPYAKSFDELENDNSGSDTSIARTGETHRQSEWRDELLRAGVRAKGGKIIQFTRVEPFSGTKFIQAEAETKEDVPKKVLVVFGPEHAPLEQRQVENAWQEARALNPDMLLFCAFQFDDEAAKDIDELTPKIAGMRLLKAQMNADMFTDDLRKKRSSNESFWLVGQPDVKMESF